MTAAATRPNRAVISDDGVAIRLLVYSPLVAEPLGVVELSPEQAVRLCADLSVAAAARMARNGRDTRGRFAGVCGV